MSGSFVIQQFPDDFLLTTAVSSLFFDSAGPQPHRVISASKVG